MLMPAFLAAPLLNAVTAFFFVRNHDGLYDFSLATTTDAMILHATVPIYTFSLGACFLSGDILHRKYLITGWLLCLGGTVLVALTKVGGKAGSSPAVGDAEKKPLPPEWDHRLQGVVYLLASSVCLALFSVVIRSWTTASVEGREPASVSEEEENPQQSGRTMETALVEGGEGEEENPQQSGRTLETRFDGGFLDVQKHHPDFWIFGCSHHVE